MARHLDINSIDQNNTENTDIKQLEVGDNGNFSLPTGHFIGDASLSQDGQSLVLEFSEGEKFNVENYFASDNAPLIEDSNGGVLNEGLVNSFLESSPEYAQASSITDESPVGAVEEIKGSATVTRADGSHEEITLGTPIYQGDVVQTSDDGAVNIMFVDETSMAISESARIAVDKYEFDAATESGVTDLSVLRGVFVYTSGLIGRDDPDDVTIETPVGSIGIRGTIIAGNINPEGESEISVLEGAIVVTNGTGETTLSQQYETVKLSGFQNEIEYKGVEAANDIGKTYGSVSDVLPKLFSSINDTAKEEVKADKAEEKTEEEVEASEEIINETSEEQSDASTETIDVLAEQTIETTADFSNEFTNTEAVTEDNNTETLTQSDSETLLNASTTTSNNSVPDEILFQEERDFTPETVVANPQFTRNFNPIFEQTKAGSVVGTFTLSDYPPGTLVQFDLGGTTDNTAGEFDIVQVAGTHEFKITLNIDIGVAGTTLTPINIVAVLSNGTIIPITSETPIVEDAVVNIGSTPAIGGFEYETRLAASNPDGKVQLDIDGDGTLDEIHIENIGMVGNINLNDNPLFTNNTDTYSDISNLGDINNDGYDDFVIGVEGRVSEDASINDVGAIGIIRGNAAGTPVGDDRDDWVINPENGADDLFGSSVTGIGDFDGDGIEDILVGSINNREVGADRPGAAFILTNYSFSNNPGGVFNSSIQSTTHIEGVGGDDFDYSKFIDGIGDFNGDGLSDVLIGYNGGTQIIYGGMALGPDINYDNISIDRSFNITGTNFLTGASAGDINGDGFDDFAVSHDDGTDINTYVVYGRDGINNNLDLTYLENPDHALKINHEGAGGSNYQITALGDIDDDGFDDLQVGIEGGEQFIVYGQVGGSAHVIVTDDLAGLDNSSDTAGLITASNSNQSLVGNVDFFDGGTGGATHTGLRMSGGGGDNNFGISHNQFDRIDGGGGFDTITTNQTGNSIDFSNFNFEQIQGIEEIEFGAANQTITLTAENIFNLLKTSDDGELRISGQGSIDFVVDDPLVTNDITKVLNSGGDGTANFSGTTNFDGTDYLSYHVGGYDLFIEFDVGTTINFV